MSAVEPLRAVTRQYYYRPKCHRPLAIVLSFHSIHSDLTTRFSKICSRILQPVSLRTTLDSYSILAGDTVSKFSSPMILFFWLILKGVFISFSGFFFYKAVIKNHYDYQTKKKSFLSRGENYYDHVLFRSKKFNSAY